MGEWGGSPGFLCFLEPIFRQVWELAPAQKLESAEPQSFFFFFFFFRCSNQEPLGTCWFPWKILLKHQDVKLIECGKQIRKCRSGSESEDFLMTTPGEGGESWKFCNNTF